MAPILTNQSVIANRRSCHAQTIFKNGKTLSTTGVYGDNRTHTP
ncbi:hypothetical protein [Moraxella bovis]|nr:hypothetical protein [Moraxella bovis]